MKEGVEKVQGNDKTQLFVNGVEECWSGCMAKSIKIYYCLVLRFPLYFRFKAKYSWVSDGGLISNSQIWFF